MLAMKLRIGEKGVSEAEKRPLVPLLSGVAI
jgi:hypothetical protein